MYDLREQEDKYLSKSILIQSKMSCTWTKGILFVDVSHFNTTWHKKGGTNNCWTSHLGGLNLVPKFGLFFASPK